LITRLLKISVWLPGYGSNFFPANLLALQTLEKVQMCG